ncbi:MAG: glycoside hydrolase family 2 [Ruminococcaceae bacterium]|nr:glycoside hydrolase family 2 [Oscillospiraceae bacterium]
MKHEIFPTLITPYVSEMNSKTPWCEYPRPSMVRDSFFCLNGAWDFAVCKPNEQPKYNEKILVPFSPESLLSGVQREIPEGSVMHYRRIFSLPEGFGGEQIILHFGAVDTICDVYLNGKHLVHHKGGYLPFSAEAGGVISEGENELYVKVVDNLSPLYPYGKQRRDRGGMWYTPTSGIWQTVWMEAVPKNHIEKLKITPTTKDVKIEVIGGDDKKRLTLLDDGEIFEFNGNEIIITPKNIRLWTPEEPNLYRFKLESGEDCVESYFALREISTGRVDGIPRILLNGKPYLFNGLLDQGYFPDGIFLPATSKGYENDILTAKNLGFNMLRKHIKIEPEIFYHLCDKLGMVVFQDMVNNSGYSYIFDTVLPTIGMKRFPDGILHTNKRSRAIFEEHMYAIMEHLYSFPSVLYYTIFNEGWGQFNADKMYEKAKKFDPTRIFDSTSGWFTRSKSDVDSRHVYFKAVKLGKTTDKPIVISEFGGYSYRVEGHLFGSNNYGYSIFEDEKSFTEAFLKLYSEQIEPLIDKGICALVYTQVSDVEDETNGLITYDRKCIKPTVDKTREQMSRLYKKI